MVTCPLTIRAILSKEVFFSLHPALLLLYTISVDFNQWGEKKWCGLFLSSTFLPIPPPSYSTGSGLDACCLHANRLINIFRGVKSDPSAVSLYVYTLVIIYINTGLLLQRIPLYSIHRGWKGNNNLKRKINTNTASLYIYHHHRCIY